MMNKKSLITLFGLMFSLIFLPGAAFAGDLVLDSFNDLTTDPINLPATDLQLATIGTSANQGGDDPTDTTVAIGGTVAAADIAQVCVYYGGLLESCQNNPGNLASIVVNLPGNTKGGSPFEYHVTLNASAAGKTIQLGVLSFGGSTHATSTITLPQYTATVNIVAVATAPTVTAQAATAIGTDSATLHGTVTDAGTAPDNDRYFQYGTNNGGPYGTNSGVVSTGTTGTFQYTAPSLTPNTTYYYIACADGNEAGGQIGCSTQQSFTTNKLAPTVTVQAATVTGSSTATLNGNVTVNGSAADNDSYFKYGTTTLTYTVTTASAGTVATGPFSL
ncbi:MAG: hypothetical protein IMF09_08915, partial [Proteobacteria bacterium]|nr:hypothetical protein [Pseudomonadota bacterium]